MQFSQLWKRINLMRNRQPKARPPNSPAKHVFPLQKRVKFRCRRLGQTVSKPLTHNGYSPLRTRFSGAETRFFPADREKLRRAQPWPEPAVRRRDPVGEDRVGGV